VASPALQNRTSRAEPKIEKFEKGILLKNRRNRDHLHRMCEKYLTLSTNHQDSAFFLIIMLSAAAQETRYSGQMMTA